MHLRNTMVGIGWPWFALVMRAIKLSLKINRLKTHQFKQQTSPQTSTFRDKSNGQF